jgi:hypothetical protein
MIDKREMHPSAERLRKKGKRNALGDPEPPLSVKAPIGGEHKQIALKAARKISKDPGGDDRRGSGPGLRYRRLREGYDAFLWTCHFAFAILLEDSLQLDRKARGR